MSENSNTTTPVETEKAKNIGKNSIILIVVFVILVAVGGWYFITQQNKKPVVAPNNPTNHQTNIDTNITQTAEEKGEEILLQAEKQKLVEDMNSKLMPNYVKLKSWNEFEAFGTYKDPGVTFFTISLEPYVTDETLADYAVYVSKDLVYEEDFAKADALYKQQIEMSLRDEVMNWYQAKLMKFGAIGAIKKTGHNQYSIDFLGDYIVNKWGTNKGISPTLAGKIALLGEYFNYGETYLTKESKDFYKLMEEIKTELNDQEFSTLAENINKVYFREFIK